MSGIAGLVLSSAAPPPDPATLARLIDSLRHRGPRSAATRSSAASRSCTTGSRSSILPPWTSRCSLVRSSATEQDVKVVLSGEGGDEIFAGYPRCHTAMGPWWRGGRAMRGRGSRCAGRAPVDLARRYRRCGGRDVGHGTLATGSEMADWAPPGVLLKLDRCLMAHAMEGRIPLLDSGVAKAAFRLADGMKLRGGLGKEDPA